MNGPFLWFMVAVLSLATAVTFFVRRVLHEIATQAAQHAKQYASTYARGGAMISAAYFTSAIETLGPISPDVAAAMNWTAWVIAFFKPLVAAIIAFIAFMDGSVQRLRDSNPAA